MASLRRTRWFPWDPALGHPRERPIVAVTQRSTVQRRVAGHHGLDAIDVVRVDRLLELRDLLPVFFKESMCALSFGQLANP